MELDRQVLYYPNGKGSITFIVALNRATLADVVPLAQDASRGRRIRKILCPEQAQALGAEPGAWPLAA